MTVPAESQQYKLARALPAKFIEKKPGSNADYIPHFIVEQAIIAAVGAFDWELVQVLRGPVPATTTRSGTEYPELPNAVTGVVYRMTMWIDGRKVTIEEVGSCDAAAFENNDGERMKKATSDALKRCAMRVGVGLHLWCKNADQYFLPSQLRMDHRDDGEVVVGVEAEGTEEAG